MNFEFIATYVELQDIPSYSTNITVEGQLLKLSFLWNERIGKRVLSIKNTSDVVYLQNTILHPNEPLELNSNAVLDDLPYSITLVKTGGNKVGNIFNWSKDFILCFSRTVDLDVKKLNVVYGVTTSSTPAIPKPFGNWVLNQGYELVDDYIVYTAYKTNQISYYDSYANFDLVTALVRSFHDPDLQEYIAFTTAVEQLTGTADWVLDPANNQIRYADPNAPSDPDSPALQYYYIYNMYGADKKVSTINEACILAFKAGGWAGQNIPPLPNYYGCQLTGDNILAYGPGGTFGQIGVRVANPTYDPSAEDDREKTIPLEIVAQKVISNAETSSDQGLKMLSEDYIEIVANSIFDTNISKQFIKFDDLIPQLETNKILR